jgi:hypothetical protein
MISLEVIAILLSGISISASLVYYSNVLANSNKTRKAQLFMSIYKITIDEEMNKKWYDAMEMSLKDFRDVRVTMHTLFQKYNGIGHLMMQELLDVDSAYHYSEGYRAVLLWKKWGDHILGARSSASNPDYMDGFQYMAENMMKYRDEKGLPNELLPHFTN